MKHAFSSPVPARQETKLTYSYGLYAGTAQTAFPTFGTAASYELQFRGNSVFDPDKSGVGHQPMGFDQWSAFYDHYYVKSVEATVYFESVASGKGPSQVLLTPSRSNTSPYAGSVGQDLIWERYYSAPHGHHMRVGTHALLTSSGVSNGGPKTIKGKWYTKEMLPNYDPDEASAAVTANPTDEYYLYLDVVFPLTISDSTFYMYIVLKYDVMFSEPKLLGSS